MCGIRRVAYGLLILFAFACVWPLCAQQAKWEDLKKRVENLYSKGDYASAIPVAREALRLAETTFGADDPNVATALNNLGLLYEEQSKYADAEPLLKRALSIREKAFGSDRPEFARSLSVLAQLYEHEAKYSDAEPLYARALAIDEKALGPEDTDVGTILTNLGNLYEEKGEYAKAEPMLKRALAIDEKALDPDDPAIAADLNNLAELFDDETRLADEEPLLKRALAINEKALGDDHPIVAKALNNLAEVYEHEGKYAEAEPLFQRSLEIRKKRFGADDPVVADGLNNLAELRIAQGRYAEGEPLLITALRIDEKALGRNHPSIAIDLNNLGSLYHTLGKYALEEPLLQRCLAIREKVLGPEHPDIATALNNLGELYEAEGRYNEARPLLMRALEIDQKTRPLSPELAMDFNNVANLDETQGIYPDAEQALRLSLEIVEKAYGPDHPDVSTALNNLAAVEVDQNKYSEAEPLYRRSLSIDEKALGPEHPDVARTLSNLALLLDDEGKFTEAERLYARALNIDEKALGSDHPANILTLNNFAELYEHQGKFAQAEPFFDRALNNLFLQFQYNFTFMTEKQRLEFLDSVDNYFPIYYSFVYRYHDKDPKLAGTMYNLLLWQKGFIAGSIADMRRKIEASGDAEAIKLLEELTSKRGQLAALLNARPPDRDLWRKQIEQLRVDSAEVEKALVARSASFAEKRKLDRATWQQVRDALAPGEASVEFARFRYFDKDWTSRSYYVVLVLTHETKDAPQYIVLGDDKQVEDGAVTEFRQGLQSRGLAGEQEIGIPAAHAWDLIWKPLERALVGKGLLYVSPDGMLNEVPLGIIPAPDGTLAMERYDLRILSSTKDILRSRSPHASASALLMGDPTFDLLDSPMQPKLESAALEGKARVENRTATLPPLPGTGAEVAAIATLMRNSGWKTSIYTRDAALKHVIEQADSPRVMHLATHGFFLPDQLTRMAKLGLEKEQTPGLADPMLRSGLYFAGADRTLAGRPVPEGKDNGVLTAMEAGNLNLAGTELIVLSACNTGKGDVKTGEGVFGLRRALQEAGAQAVLMSMWSVPDKQTMELMQRFYAKWLAGTEMHKALKDAQLEIREQVKSEHGGRDLPYYWGAFVLVGR